MYRSVENEVPEESLQTVGMRPLRFAQWLHSYGMLVCVGTFLYRTMQTYGLQDKGQNHIRA
ncbi:MAG: hypothetical protein LBQ66_01925 [Planctomycetaceae bacterium]|nr:hypothetical protein [Planctomycetaceae bacterium]